MLDVSYCGIDLFVNFVKNVEILIAKFIINMIFLSFQKKEEKSCRQNSTSKGKHKNFTQFCEKQRLTVLKTEKMVEYLEG